MQNVVKQAFTETSASGTELTIDNTIEARMDLKLKGNTSQQQYSGKNLVKLYETNKGITDSGLSYDLDDDGKLSIKGTTNRPWDYTISKPIDFEVGKTYTFSVIFLNIANNTTPPIFYLLLSANNGGKKEISKFSTSITFTIKELQKIPIMWSMPKNLNVDFSLKLQIEEGSTATDYEPYTGGIASPNPDYPQEIHCVKGNNVVTISNGNVLPNNLSDGAMNGITFTINDDKSINLRGIATSRVEPKLYDGAGYTIPAGVYKNTTAYNIIGYTGGTEYLVFNANAEINLTQDVTFKNLYFRIENGATVNETIYPQIILSSKTDTSYVPHKDTKHELNLGNIELNAIDKFKDYFKKENGKWYKVEKIKSIIADGTNYLCNYMFPNGTFFIYSNAEKNTLRDAFKISGLSLFSNYLISKTYTAVFDNGEVGAIYNVGTGEIGVNVGISSNKKDINTWLSTHNMIVKYILQTPNQIEITDTTLITQLDEISQALSKKGNTIITQNNDNLPFHLDVIALTK